MTWACRPRPEALGSIKVPECHWITCNDVTVSLHKLHKVSAAFCCIQIIPALQLEATAPAMPCRRRRRYAGSDSTPVELAVVVNVFYFTLKQGPAAATTTTTSHGVDQSPNDWSASRLIRHPSADNTTSEVGGGGLSRGDQDKLRSAPPKRMSCICFLAL